MIRTALLLLLALLLGGAPAGLAPPASGQTPDGEIRGTLVQGSAGAPAPEHIAVELIILGGASGLETVQTVSGAGGTFLFEAPADPQRTYVVRAEYQGVQYLSPPLLLSRELPTTDVELTIYEATRERPGLRIEATLVTLLALDRAAAQLTIERTDEVTNPGDRIYVGDAEGVTLRLPLPDGVVAASGAGTDSGFVIEGGVIAATTALRPGVTSVVTRYVVGYDRAADAYTLRITAPFPTGRMEIEVPGRFVQDLEPLGASERADSREVATERVEVIVRPAARPGESVSVRLEGLAGRNAANPLTDRGGALAGVLLALLVTGGGALLLRAGLRRAGAGGSA